MPTAWKKAADISLNFLALREARMAGDQ